LAQILSHYGGNFAELEAGGFRIVSLCGEDAVLGAPDRNGMIEPTRLYERIYEQAGDLKPKHIGIDTSADVYAGSEIDRAQVRQFIGLLRRLARVANGSVVLLSHPSLTGIQSGSGISGSTAWHNSVRSRFYMTSPKAEGDEQPDTDLRELVFKKNNYGRKGDSIMLQYRGGLFLPAGGISTIDKAAYDMNVEDVFLSVLSKLTKRGIDVSPLPTSHAYAPTLIARDPGTKAIGKRAFADAMGRLLDRERIYVEEVGRAGREKKVLRPGPK
jgi:RecA-family ATPase